MEFVSNGMSVEVKGKQGIRGMAGPDGNPIGTVISYMGKSVPGDYLICNGETHQISDWPDLADFFLVQYGKKNQFGGDGTLTFGVPTLSDENGILKCIKATKEEPYEDIYTEEEMVVGRWIDGKLVYRKVVLTKTPPSSNPSIIAELGLECMIINVHGFFNDKYGNRTWISSYISPSIHAAVYTNGTGNKLWMECADNLSKYYDCDATIIIEYTKTTG